MSKLQVFAFANGRYMELDGRVKSVTVGGDTAKCYRTASVSIINAVNLRKSVLQFENGKELRVLYDGVEVFRGIVMQHTINTDADTTLTAHDFNFYLTKNADTVNYKDKRADEILRDLCSKFNVPVGNITNTNYVLKKFIKSGTVYELVMATLKETQLQTGKAYRLRNKNGQVELTDVEQVDTVVTLKNGQTITSAEYSESIEELQTQVKLTGGDEKKPITALATAPTAGQYGVTQHFEHISDVKKASELQAKAQAMVAEMSRPKTSVKVDALGNTAVMSGTAVGVIESMTRLSGTYTVESDSHDFDASGSYTMSLTLTKL